MSSSRVGAVAPEVVSRPPHVPGRPWRKRPASARSGVAGFLFFVPFLLVFVGVIVIPLGYAVYLSFFQDRLIGGNVFAGLDNYRRALSDPAFLSGVARVLLFVSIQVPIMLAIALVAALALDSGRLWLPRAWRLGIFMPYAVPGVVAALMWGYLYGNRFGLVGQVEEALGIDGVDLLAPDLVLGSIGNIVVWGSIGFNMLIFYAALQSVPSEVYEAAEIDGANEWRKAWSIKLPALRPAVLLTLIFSIIGSFQLFSEPNVLRTLAPTSISSDFTPNMYAYNLAFSGQQLNYAAAVAMVLGGVTIVVAYVVQVINARQAARR